MNHSNSVVIEPDGVDIDANDDFLVSDSDKLYFRVIVQYSIQVLVQCFGIATNIINIIVFVKIGLNDSVTITIFGLAISDLLHLITYLIYRLVPMYDYYFGVTSGISPMGFAYPFSLYAIYFYDVSMYMTVFAALQKCCCVTFPLKFKNTFTIRRTCITLVAISVITLAMFMPVLTGLPFALVHNPFTNQTLLTVKILPHYRPAEYYWQSVVKVGLTSVSQITVVICLILMTINLQASARFRIASKAKTESTTTQNTSRKETKMSKNEYRALQAVQFVCFVFVVASLPPSAAYMVQSLYPPLNTAYMLNLKHVIFNVTYFFGTINASVNIFFYLKFNTKYKIAFTRMFGCQQRHVSTSDNKQTTT